MLAHLNFVTERGLMSPCNHTLDTRPCKDLLASCVPRSRATACTWIYQSTKVYWKRKHMGYLLILIWNVYLYGFMSVWYVLITRKRVLISLWFHSRHHLSYPLYLKLTLQSKSLEADKHQITGLGWNKTLCHWYSMCNNSKNTLQSVTYTSGSSI